MGTAQPDPFARFRRVALAEGLSLLVLLGVAMPLKYLADLPIAVRIVGSIHGALFLWYGVEVADLCLRKVWGLRAAAVAMIMSSIPLGTFWLDRRLRPDARG